MFGQYWLYWSHQIPPRDRIGRLDKELSLGQQTVWANLEATAELYDQTITIPGADSCSCNSCKNFAVQRGEVFPEEFDRFLRALGIDPLKEWEAFDYDFDVNSDGHLYGGWFLFVGGLTEGIDEQPDGRREPFDYWFTTSFPSGTLPVGRQY